MSIEIVRQVIDLREQLFELAEEAGLILTLQAAPSNGYRHATISLPGNHSNFYMISRSDSRPEEIKLLWFDDDKESDVFDNLTQVDLALLEVEDDG